MPNLDLVGAPITIPTARFELLSPDLLRAFEDGGKLMIHGVASSTTKDLHGDTILRSALEDMERAAVGMTIFLNHQYNVPQDVAGSVTKAWIKTEGVDDVGDPNHSLHFDIEVEDDNPEAVKAHKYLKKGRKLGLSIGAMIPKDGARRQKDGTYLIDHINLLETSIVGIPANPKSWVQYAKSALDLATKAKTTELGNPTLTLDGDSYRIEGSLKGLELNLAADPEKSIVTYGFAQTDDEKTEITRTIQTGEEVQNIVLGAWDLSDPDDKVAALATIGLEDVIEKATVWVTTRDGDSITIGDPPVESTDKAATADPDTTKAKCKDCGRTDCDHEYHDNAAPDPDVTDAKVRIIEVDTDAPASDDGQGASSSEPDDAALSAPPADAGTEPLILDSATEDELLKLSFGQLQAAALATLNELVETKRLYGEEKAARVSAETQRDAVIEAATTLVQKTAAMVEKVANSPLTRKAVANDIRQTSASIESYYGEEFARAIAGNQS